MIRAFLSFHETQGSGEVILDPQDFPLVASHPDLINLLASFLQANMEQVETYLEEA